jgi:hypothetical protein
MAAQRCETRSGFDCESGRNPGLPYASPSGYFTYRNSLLANV